MNRILNLFGYELVKIDDFVKDKSVLTRLSLAYRWFSGWKDLDIIFEYIYDSRRPSIYDVRREYAKARGTDVYGNKL